MTNELVKSLEQKDRMFFSLSDTLDVKASIGLVLITFLAAQTADLLSKELSQFLDGVQVLCVVILAVASIFALLTIKPRKHDVEATEKMWIYRDDLRAHFLRTGEVDPDEKADQELVRTRVKGFEKQIEHNRQIAHRKSNFVNCCYYLVFAAFTLNLLTLTCFAVSQYL